MMSWHVDEQTMRRYADGAIDPANAASIEAHVLTCAVCRRLATQAADPERLERLWVEVRDAADRPRRRWIERLLVGVGMRDHVARLVGATPALQASWLVAVAAALAFAVMAAYHARSGVLAFLVMAPIVPLVGVAAAYGPGIDPTFEVGVAAPMRGFHLLLARATAVLTTSIGLAGIASLALPRLDWTAAAWLLPAVALTLSSLALGSYIHPAWASGWIGFGWISAVPLIERASAARLAAFHADGQVVFAVVAIVAGVVVLLRREAFEKTEG